MGHNPGQVLVAPVVLVLLLGGCTVRSLRAEEPDGRYCFKSVSRFVCTAQPVPDRAIQADAMAFARRHGVLTVYVVRNDRPDSLHHVPIVIDSLTRVDTIPASVVRVLMAPGRHDLAVDWGGKSRSLGVHGGSGELIFVRLVGEIGLVGPDIFRLERIGEDDGRRLAMQGKLIAAIDLNARH